MDFLKKVKQKLKILKEKILKQITKFYIFKNIALILYILKMRPYFKIYKILHLEEIINFFQK